MHYAETAALIFAIVFILNVVPAFMPPTWMVLAYATLRYDVSLLALVPAGALGATAGRLVLAKMSNVLIRGHLLSAKSRENIDQIKSKLESKPKLTFGVFLLYAFSPFPSNNLFIAYGLTSMALKYVAIPFFGGRLVSYTAWSLTASTVARQVAAERLQDKSFYSAYFIVSQIFTLALVWLFTRVDWKVLFQEKKFRLRKGNNADGSAGGNRN